MHSSKLESWIAFWIFEGKLQRFRHKSSWIFWKGHKMWPFLQDSPIQIIFYIRSGRPQFWIGGGLSIEKCFESIFSPQNATPFYWQFTVLRWAYCKQSPPLSSLVVGKSWRCQCDVIPHMSQMTWDFKEIMGGGGNMINCVHFQTWRVKCCVTKNPQSIQKKPAVAIVLVSKPCDKIGWLLPKE